MGLPNTHADHFVFIPSEDEGVAERAAGSKLSPGPGETVPGYTRLLFPETCKACSLSPLRIPAPGGHTPLPATLVQSSVTQASSTTSKLRQGFNPVPPRCYVQKQALPGSQDPPCSQPCTASIQSWKGPQLPAYTTAGTPMPCTALRELSVPQGRVTRPRAHPSYSEGRTLPRHQIFEKT